MKPAAFEFVRAGSIAEATHLLAETNDTARVVAGAQSLGPMLNLRLVQPRLLVDVTGVPDLTRVEDAVDALTIGACITTANIEDQSVPLRGLEALPPIAMHIAYRAVRNRGTVGGSVCHADPAADWVSALCALGAECLITGPTGGRRMPVEQFVTGAYETALASGEILEAIRLPRLSANGRLGYCKVCRKAGEFALAIGAVLNDPERGQLRIVIGATGGSPIVIADAHGLQDAGGQFDQEALERLMEARGIRSRVERRQKVAAVERAYRQAAP
jgi:aerobic carbon-monoxide dehydrogenase medium subunit